MSLSNVDGIISSSMSICLATAMKIKHAIKYDKNVCSGNMTEILNEVTEYGVTTVTAPREMVIHNYEIQKS